MNPQDLPKGAGAAETPGNGKAANTPGIYEHKASGKQVIVMPDAQGSGQQDALVRMGFEKVAEPPTAQELHDMQQAQIAKDAKTETTIVPAAYDPNAVRHNLTSTISEGGSTTNPVETTAQAPSDSEALLAAKAKNEALQAELAALKAAPTPPVETTPEVETPAEDAAEPAEEVPVKAEAPVETQTKEEGTTK